MRSHAIRSYQCLPFLYERLYFKLNFIFWLKNLLMYLRIQLTKHKGRAFFACMPLHLSMAPIDPSKLPWALNKWRLEEGRQLMGTMLDGFVHHFGALLKTQHWQYLAMLYIYEQNLHCSTQAENLTQFMWWISWKFLL